jgi:hypothetical protein
LDRVVDQPHRLGDTLVRHRFAFEERFDSSGANRRRRHRPEGDARFLHDSTGVAAQTATGRYDGALHRRPHAAFLEDEPRIGRRQRDMETGDKRRIGQYRFARSCEKFVYGNTLRYHAVCAGGASVQSRRLHLGVE